MEFIRDRLASRVCVYNLKIDREVHVLQFDKQGERVVVASTGGDVEAWNVSSGKSVMKFPGHRRGSLPSAV